MSGKLDQPDPSIGYAFPAGHLGHLTPDQQSSFINFKQVLADRGLYTPSTDGKPPSHGDHSLLRFLRARKFDIEGAHDQFVAAEKWRKNNRLGELYESIDIKEYDETRKLYPQWIGTRDKRGMPVYLFEVGPLDTKKVLAKEKATEVKGTSLEGRTEPAKMLVVMALYENLTRFVTPWCSALSNRPHLPAPITQGCNIIDIKGTGLKQFWDLKNHLQDSSALATAYHPETLDKIFIIGAPSFFPSVWSWVKRWFDPVVVSKMFILSNTEVTRVLSEHIDPDQFPMKYGGKHTYNFGDLPNLNAGVLEGWTWSEGFSALPPGPVRWEEGSEGEMVAFAVGSEEDGTKRHVEVGRLKGAKWRDAFFPVVEHTGGVGADATPRPSTSSVTAAQPTSAGPPVSEADLEAK